MKNKQKFLTLNLQHFADIGSDDGGSQGSEPSNSNYGYSDLPEYEGGLEVESMEANIPNPLLVDDVSDPGTNQPEAKQGEQQETPTGEEAPEFDFGGRKVRPDDPESIKGVYQDWQQQQQYIQQLQQQNKQFQQMMDMMQQQGTNQPQQQEQQGPSQERLQAIHEEYMDKMYDNVFEAQKWLHAQPEYQEFLKQQITPIVEPYVQPLEQERQYNQQIQKMQQQYSDFDSLIPQMQQILEERPDIGNRDDALETVYWMAKGQTAAQQPSPEQLLSDPNFQQQILTNEQIRNQILQQYATQKQQTNQNIPPVMGRNPSGQSPAYREQAPRTLAEGSRAFRRSLGLS